MASRDQLHAHRLAGPRVGTVENADRSVTGHGQGYVCRGWSQASVRTADAVQGAHRQRFRQILTPGTHIPPEIVVNYNGSCHCGQISYSVEGDLEQVMECNCSHCSRKGYLLWFVPRARLKLASPESALATYTFNKHVISHHFCPKCGCAPFGFGKDRSGAATAAINVRCLEGVDLSSLKIAPVDGRSF